MSKSIRVVLAILMVLSLTACGAVFEDGNLKVMDGNKAIISLGKDGFLLDGNFTGLNLNADGLRINYPDGSIVWGDDGINISQGQSKININDGKLVYTGKDGQPKVLDTEGGGAELKGENGVLVRTGQKATLPQDYPAAAVPLMDGFVLNASAELGKVQMISGYVAKAKVQQALDYYQPLLMKGDSYKQDKADGRVILQAKLDGLNVAVYVVDSLTSDAVNLSIVLNR